MTTAYPLVSLQLENGVHCLRPASHYTYYLYAPWLKSVDTTTMLCLCTPRMVNHYSNWLPPRETEVPGVFLRVP
jgi:hypothetical protein